jgi:hypothetical protein
MKNRCHTTLAVLVFASSFLNLAIADSQKKLDKKRSKPDIASLKGTDSDTPFRELATVPVEDNPKLPRVLLIGDSITMGYTVPLRELLKDEANVHFPHENCHSSRDILKNIEAYLGNKPWDVIQFNCGIHDVTRLNDAGKSIKAGEHGKQRVSIDEYRANLETIIARLQKTGAALIWCSTTPVGDNLPHRKPEDVVRYNAAAAEIMHKHGIPVTDLHKLSSANGKPKWSDGVHFTVDGSRQSARGASLAIDTALTKRASKDK